MKLFIITMSIISLFCFMLLAEEMIFEAEDGVLNGVEIINKRQGFSGTGYVSGFDDEKDSVVFKIIIKEEGHYELFFKAAVEQGWGSKINDILVNNKMVGTIKTEDRGIFYENPQIKVWLEKGTNTIIVRKNWGWFDLDSLTIRRSVLKDIPAVRPSLVVNNPHPNAVKLMKYLCDIYGKKVLAGQQLHYEKDSIGALKDITGKEPVILGLDMMDYSLSRVARGTKGRAIEQAIEWWKKGGIVSFCWHWNAPMHLIDKEPDRRWWSGFYTKATEFDIEYALKNPSSAEYKALIRDIDTIAEELKRLQKEGIPVLWRPLHEASGGWFWWGAKGPENYLKLYRLLFIRLTKHHKLNNLIWVWNGQSETWYPGDNMVDIIGEDIYFHDHNHESGIERFERAQKYSKIPKLISLTENGPLPDPALIKRDSAWWVWFMTWGGFIEDELHTKNEFKRKVFDHDIIITLDELPDIKNYPLK